jgi:hypothetical protein
MMLYKIGPSNHALELFKGDKVRVQIRTTRGWGKSGEWETHRVRVGTNRESVMVGEYDALSDAEATARSAIEWLTANNFKVVAPDHLKVAS